MSHLLAFHRVAPFVMSALLGCITSWSSYAVNLAWDPSPDPDIAAYVVYWGYESVSYEYSTNVGLETSVVINNLSPGMEYYFAVTAVNRSGLESDPSNEISYRVPGGRELPPTISAIPDQATLEATATPIGFIIGDGDTPAENLEVSVTSSNPLLVPARGVAFSGGDSNRSIAIKPITGQSGTAVITVTVADHSGNSASENFVLAVVAPHSPVLLTAASFQPAEPGFAMTFLSAAEGRYFLEYTDDVGRGPWLRRPETYLGTGLPLTIRDPNPASQRRFYRVVSE